ncbi:unnamed protein product [Rodentolepis nana]|uniref:PDZ domain-containing protein n=1 Tax=Rodentolepis nana TaxID=102285 RepID=A0A0R3T862_RODNA|nr:unnamed protein product [Rodentolepis nana]
MAFSDDKCNSSSTLTTQISKEAIKRVHEQIFGNPFIISNRSQSGCLSSRVQTPRLRLPCPDFSIHYRTPYAVCLDKANLKYYQQLYIETRQNNHALLTKCPSDFSLGVLPGDVIASINDVDVKQLSSEDVKEKFASGGPNELKLILIPSEGCLELSTRSIYLNDCHLDSLQNFPTVNNSNSSCICLRGYIKEKGCLRGINVSIKKMYVNILHDIASHSNGLWSVGDIVLITHRDGYSNGALVEILPEDEYQVKLVPGEQILTVNSDDINRVSVHILIVLIKLKYFWLFNNIFFTYRFYYHFSICCCMPYFSIV